MADKLLKTIRPNAGVRQRYQREMLTLVQEMHDSLLYWLKAQYREAPPELAMDATPSQDMQKRFKELSKKWQGRWDKASLKIAASYVKGSFKATDSAMQAALKEYGIAVKFNMTPAVRDAFQASLAENVSLIRNVGTQYLAQVEGTIMRAYSAGRDLDAMSKGLVEHLGVTRRRAANIALDQSNKANGVCEHARRLELGITEAIWRHSGGSRHPRKEHVKANGRRYKVADGCPIANEKGIVEYILPGEKIFCHCSSRSVIPGL